MATPEKRRILGTRSKPSFLTFPISDPKSDPKSDPAKTPEKLRGPPHQLADSVRA